MYILTKTKILVKDGYVITYGFRIKNTNETRYKDLSTDFKKVKNFVDLLNKQKAEPSHLPFLVEEFLEK